MSLRKQIRTTGKYEQILNSEGIYTIKDLLQYLPRTYENRNEIKTLNQLDLQSNDKQTVKAKILKKNFIPTRKGKLLKIKFEDTQSNTGYINYMNTTYQASRLDKDKRYLIIGKPQSKGSNISFWYPKVIKSTEDNKNQNLGIYPVYSELQGIKPDWFAKKIYKQLDKIPDLFQERFPKDFLEKFDLLDIHQTIKNIHYPKNKTKLQKAKRRFFFERLLKVQISSQIKKQEFQKYNQKTSQSQPDRDIIKNFLSELPFELTKDQKRAIKNIVNDFHSNQSMLRMLQGDVGSGKTIVSIACIYYITQKFKGQSAFLAPTEVLAQQHYKNIVKLLSPLGLQVKLLTGSVSPKQKEKIKMNLKHGQIDTVVGTHAIIQKDVEFNNLNFAIIDEQHKFGVLQRGFFKKFNSPHILQMTATPIPRSLAMAYFGEFTVSNIKEMPKGRKPIHTKVINQKEFEKLKPWIKTKLGKGQQIYIVTPLIQDSQELENVQSVTQEYQDIMNFLPNHKDQIGLLHGNLKNEEKNKVMNQFKKGNIQILVSTTVIEVGVDVPKATVMIIKNAERFGLSQLHQLRGRVGRSDLQSYCFLMSKSSSETTRERLSAMEEYNDGFKLSKIDLEIRGSGEFLGTRQSGLSDIPIQIIGNTKFVEKTKQAAKRLIENHPDLDKIKEIRDKTLQESEIIV